MYSLRRSFLTCFGGFTGKLQSSPDWSILPATRGSSKEIDILWGRGEPPESLGCFSYPAWPSQEQEPPFPLGTKGSPISNDWSVCRLGKARELLLVLTGPMVRRLAFEAFPLGLASGLMVEPSCPLWVALRLQGTADTNSYQFSVSLGVPFSMLSSILFLSLISIIKYSKGHL